MDPKAWLASIHSGGWSLNNFPIGIGLTVAAHVHLRNKFSSITDNQVRGHHLRKSIMLLDQVLSFLEDMRDIDNAIRILDKVIEDLEKDAKRQHCLTTITTTTAITANNHIKHQDTKSNRKQKRLHQRHGQRKARERDQVAPAGSAIMTEIENGYRIELSQSSECPEGNSESSAWITESEEDAEHCLEEKEDEDNDEHEAHHQSQSGPSRHKRRTSESTSKHGSRTNLTKWSTTCQQLRSSRDASIEKIIRQVATFDPLLVGLNTSYAFGLCGIAGATLRFAVSTKPVSNAIARVITGTQRLAVRLLFWLKSDDIDTSSSTTAAIATRFQQSTAFFFLPLMPTLCITGMHFMVAARARWIMFKVQRTYRESMLLAKKHSIAATLLSIRQQRLEWLCKEIEAFEREEREEEHGAPSGLRASPEGSHSVNNGTNGTNANNNNNRSADRRVQLAIDQFNNAVAAGLRSSSLAASNNDSHSGQQSNTTAANPADRSHAHQHASSTTSSSASSSSTNNTPHCATDRLGRHFILKNPGIQMLGPDLYTMDLEAFLQDPQERNRILRLEFKAMRTDLRFMKQQVVDQTSKAAAQARV